MIPYKLYQSKTITENFDEFVEECYDLRDRVREKINEEDTTWSYLKYNTFNMTSGSVLFYDLFKELNVAIRDYEQYFDKLDLFHNKILTDEAKAPERMWMQSWINCHTPDTVLNWHGHPWHFHGYISVDPKHSKTVFKKGWEIENKIGQIYIGPGSGPFNEDDESFNHKVVPTEEWDGDRITIGFDIAMGEEHYNFIEPQMIPIL